MSQLFTTTHKGKGPFKLVAEFMNLVGMLFNNFKVYGYGRITMTPQGIKLYIDSGTGITGRTQNGAESDINTDSTKPWVRYRKSTFAFSEETVGPTVPTDPDYIYFKKANWGGGEIVIQ